MAKTLTTQVLERAREIIAQPENWCQGTLCMMPDGSKGHGNGKWGEVVDRLLHAKAFCAIGAIHRACVDLGFGHDVGLTAANQLGVSIAKTYQHLHIAGFNDLPERTHAEVLAEFDRAINAQ